MSFLKILDFRKLQPRHLGCFSQIITFEDVVNHKPFPDAYKLALKLSNESHLNCIAIEDSSIGIEAARAANLNCLMTLPPWPYNIKNITKNANACVDSLGKINSHSNVIYGKPLINKNVDYSYLKSLIN